MVVVAKAIKKLRTKAKLSQGQLGEKLGVSKQFISNLEAARVALPEDHIYAMATALNVKPGGLINALIEDYRISLIEAVAVAQPDVLPKKEARLPRRRKK